MADGLREYKKINRNPMQEEQNPWDRLSSSPTILTLGSTLENTWTCCTTTKSARGSELPVVSGTFLEVPEYSTINEFVFLPLFTFLSGLFFVWRSTYEVSQCLLPLAETRFFKGTSKEHILNCFVVSVFPFFGYFIYCSPLVVIWEFWILLGTFLKRAMSWF